MRRALFIVALNLLPAATLAASAEHHEAHSFPWAKLLFSFVNLAIFIYLFPRLAPAILPKLGLPGSKDDLRERQQRVVEALEQAAKAKQESERLQAEWQRKLANLNEEIKALRAQAEKEISAEREQILAAARRLADTIRRDAERAAEQAVRNAESVLREEVAAQAFAAACRIAPSRIGEADQRRFVSEFINEVQP